MLKIKVPGSKSITNRALLLNYLTGNKTKIKNLARSTDSDYLLACLKKIKTAKEFYTHNAGTTTRFLTALATLLERPITIKGDARMNQRPIKELTDALNQLGAKTQPAKNGCPPIKIHAQKLRGGKAQIRGDISSQYLTALLLVLPFAENDSEITIKGDLCSKPYVDITLKLLKSFGLKVQNHTYKKFTIQGNQHKLPQNSFFHPDTRLAENFNRTVPKPVQEDSNFQHNAVDGWKKEFWIEPDASSASYPAAYAALHPHKSVHLDQIQKNSIQGDIIFLKLLKKMGCRITKTQTGTIIQGPKILRPLGEISMNDCPDLVMTFAVLAAFAQGTTKITDIANLTIKESDRLKALKTELTRLKVKTTITKSSITIEGQPNRQLPENIEIKTYEDHRIAMSFAILQDLTKNLTIENPTCTEKSYKTFWQDLKKLQK